MISHTPLNKKVKKKNFVWYGYKSKGILFFFFFEKKRTCKMYNKETVYKTNKVTFDNYCSYAPQTNIESDSIDI